MIGLLGLKIIAEILLPAEGDEPETSDPDTVGDQVADEGSEFSSLGLEVGFGVVTSFPLPASFSSDVEPPSSTMVRSFRWNRWTHLIF